MGMTNKENFLALLNGEPVDRIPTDLCVKLINTHLIPDNIARGSVRETHDVTPDPAGAQDAFGVWWVYEPEARGAMERPGDPFLMDDASDWREVITFPNPADWDWEAEAEANKEYVGDPDVLMKATIFTGFFERLISFMGFEDAAVAMIDEDQKEDVKELMMALADLYCTYIDYLQDYLNVGLIQLHDDWGSARSTFFSEDTVREIILPALKHVVDHAHERGVYIEFHSCGMIGDFVPVMIDAGCDMWEGQPINDKAALVEKYGDKLIIEVEAPQLGPDATREEMEAAADEFVATHIFPDKPIGYSHYTFESGAPMELYDIIDEKANAKLGR